MRIRFRLLAPLAFWAGIILVAINVAGLCTSLRSDAVYTSPRQKPVGRVPPAEVLFAQVNSFDGDREKYFRHVAHDVSVGIRHYWLDEGIDEYHLRVPIQENYLLYLASFVRPDRYLKYEFTDYRKAIERGVGLCSQCVVILAESLKEKHIHSRIVSLGEHVVLLAQVDDTHWWVLDPDLGVTLPYNITDIQANPALIEPYYAAAGWTAPVTHNIMRIYGHDHALIYDGDGSRGYHGKMWLAEKLSYVMIWIIPLVCMLPEIVLACRKMKTKAAGRVADPGLRESAVSVTARSES